MGAACGENEAERGMPGAARHRLSITADDPCPEPFAIAG